MTLPKKGSRLITVSVNCAGIDGAHRSRFGVEPICRVLQAAPSTYYAARTRPPSPRA
ncbi:hypothetical protein Psi02_76230 [Planotetraspora silvatica]|uniref:Transposase n=1 Tax=Planotetraspora silvatica TaxID=234614 RepID=A0A8J3XSF8_9ACTN|nr:hypothetical protein Psi02_76230 [Planotetraspora silvatica]